MFVSNKISNKLDKVVSKNMRRHKLSNLDLTNQTFKDDKPIMLKTVHNQNNKHKSIKEYLLVLTDSRSSHSMEKPC